MLDPRYKSLKCLLKFISNAEVLLIILAYDKILLKYMFVPHRNSHSKMYFKTSNLIFPASNENDSQFFGNNENLGDKKAALNSVLKKELHSYLVATYSAGSSVSEEMEWLCTQRSTFPNV